jgi:polysaccharide export outer membrane protein
VLNFPGAGEGGQPGNCTAYAARRQAPAGPGGPGSDSSAPDGEPLRQCSATAQEQAAGPAVAGEPGPAVPAGPIPRELDKVSLPDYVIEPPDVLLIDAVRGTPLPPYRIEPLDVLQVQVPDALPNEPISGQFTVEPEGTLNLGLAYGSVPVAGLTLEAARLAVNAHLKRVLKDPHTCLALAQAHGTGQQVHGEHLVRPDGTISLGVYGDLYVAGLSRCQVRSLIEGHLAQYLQDPQVALDIRAYNSKVYYVILDGTGCGEQVFRLPFTGNETVLDAIGLVHGLPPESSKKKIWVARPAPAGHPCDQVLPVDWRAITQGGSTATNYQLLPGDRVYVEGGPWICLDNALAHVLAMLKGALGFTLLPRP